MFMAVAITAIGIGIVVMVGYLVIGQVRAALPSVTVSRANDCVGTLATGELCSPSGCAEVFNQSTSAVNTSAYMTCTDSYIGAGQDNTMTTVFAGFGLVAVGIIVLAAFGLIQVFQ